jgi:hypothetical protein
MEWSPAISRQMSSWRKVSWSLWRPLFIPEVMVLSGPVGAESTGRTAEEAADRAAFGILRDIMNHFS